MTQSNSVLDNLVKLQRLTIESPLSIHLKQLEQQATTLHQATQQLRILESIQFQSTATKAMEEIRKQASSGYLIGDAFKAIQSSLSIADQITKSTAHLQASSIQRLQTEQMEQLGKTISNSMHLFSTNTMKVWQSEVDKIRTQHSIKFDFIQSALSAASLDLNRSIFDRSRFSVIDQTAAILMTNVWGRSGISQQLDALGIDYERLYRAIEQCEDIDQRPDPLPDEDLSHIHRTTGWLGKPHVSGPMTLLSLLLGIYAICLVYFPSLLPYEDKQQTKFDALEKHLMSQFQPLLEQLMNKASSKTTYVEFVVKEQVTVVRVLPKNGSMVIAEIFPNQVVTMLAENGKWIKIEYYDWLHQEFRMGWALKKYFARIAIRAKVIKEPKESL